MKNIKFSSMFILIALAFSFIGCGDNDSIYYEPIFDKKIEPKKKDKNKSSKKGTITYEKPIKKNIQPVNKQDEFITMLLKDAKKWLEAKRAIDDVVMRIYYNYFLDDGKFADLESGIDLPTVYEKLGEKHLMPRLKGFEAKDIILSKIIPTDNRLVFSVEARGIGNQPKLGYMRFDISPERVRFRVPVEIQQIIELGKMEYHRDYEEYKWLEAEDLLMGMQICFMYFLFEYRETEFDNIKYPMKLSDLAQIIEFDSEVFNKLNFFSKDDFKMQNFNYHSREFLFIAATSGKNHAPKSGSKRYISRAGWYYFAKKKPVVIKNENNNNGKKVNNTEKKPDEKPDSEPDYEPDEKPEVKKTLRLPSINGKKVKLDLTCKINVIRKKNVVYSKFVKKVPKVPYDFDNRLEKVLKEMGAKVVKTGYDAIVKVNIKIDVDANTWMEEVMSIKLFGKITITSEFGDKNNTLNGSFNARDNNMKRCFETIWDEGVDKFDNMVSYAFMKE
ncbi:MAG: hypothetical protein K8S87_05430 [Planctomycetes bacterium]|nr:hypothetical protein [Planctomycetota bacterium]